MKIKILVNVNDSIPSSPLTSSDFTITEDGANVSAQLSGCDESQNADVIICLDHSTSMIGSAGDLSSVSKLFLRSFSQLTNHLSSESRYALIPFVDSAETSFPRPPHTGAYYKPGNKADSIDFASAINKLEFKGGTNIDAAIEAAVHMLQFSFAANKAIVLVSDDDVRSLDSIARLLEEAGIKLFVMEVGKYNSERNFVLAQKTGGIYYQASDSLTYAAYMSKIAELITSEHCALSYRSMLTCPWNQHHSVSARLDIGTLSKTNWHDYVLPGTPTDSLAPAFLIQTPLSVFQTISVSEDYSCQSGLMDFRDSLMENFNRISIESKPPFSARDSLFVVDIGKPARAVYVAVDSFFNRSTATAYYFPKQDTESISPFLASNYSIDFGTRTAPTDTVASILITNPNSKALVVNKIVRSGASGTIISDLSSPMTFDPLDPKPIALRFNTDLLGDYNAKYDLYADTTHVCSFSGFGRAIGQLRINIDSVVSLTGDTGTLNLSFDAVPAPINLDTISLYLRYNGDLLEFNPDQPDCSGGNPLCNYSINYSQIDDSTLRINLFLDQTEHHPILNFTTAILPLSFRSFLTTSTSSIITVGNVSVSQGTIVTAGTGLIRVTDQCGDDFMRSYGFNTSGLTIESVSPNPAAKDISIKYFVKEAGIYEVKVFNSLGVECLRKELDAERGKNKVDLMVSTLPSGRYLLVIGGPRGSIPFPLIISQ